MGTCNSSNEKETEPPKPQSRSQPDQGSQSLRSPQSPPSTGPETSETFSGGSEASTRGTIRPANTDDKEIVGDKASEVMVCAVGDKDVGRSSLITRMQGAEWQDEVVPSHRNSVDMDPLVFDTELDIDGVEMAGIMKLSFMDMVQSDTRATDKMIQCEVLAANVVLLCYQCNSLPSLQSLKDKWFPLVHATGKSSPDMIGRPVIIVGCKLDVGVSDNVRKQAVEFAVEIGACHVLETSAKDWTGLHKLTEAICCAGLGRINGHHVSLVPGAQSLTSGSVTKRRTR
eukprot:TRINITY_DN3826_c0_g1_i1.p1 TRINITY_DN3826_c0_g1~~TRINITY_DN3826_c0_g1_i1.p1  ORF type:complete len:285 (+),score=37.40 TRINITY_DN3826_c0_g1_i1:184-1038(+)